MGRNTRGCRALTPTEGDEDGGIGRRTARGSGFRTEGVSSRDFTLGADEREILMACMIGEGREEVFGVSVKRRLFLSGTGVAWFSLSSSTLVIPPRGGGGGYGVDGFARVKD